MIHTVVIALGSNHQPEAHLGRAREELKKLIHIERLSRNMQTEAIGMVSPHFLNCMAIGTTTLSAPDLLSALKALERHCGDSRSERRGGRVHIDADLLRYDDTLYHRTDWTRDYIITLYNEITSAT